MFPIALIAIGVAVLLLGNRLAVLGAAVGALVGVVLLKLFPGLASELWVQLAIVAGLALLGFFVAGFARGIIDVVILVIGALAGAAIVLGFLDLLSLNWGVMNWILAVAGAVIGFILMRRGRRGSKDWGMIILSSLIGALLVGRGLVELIPSMKGGVVASIIVVVLAGAAMAFQSGMLKSRKEAKAAVAASSKPAASSAATTTPPPTAPSQPTTPPADSGTSSGSDSGGKA